MNPASPSPAAPIDRIMGIRDRFATGGSAAGLVVVLAALVLLFLVLLLVARVLQGRRQRQVYSPKALFQEVLRRLRLTVPQRDLLRRIARELRLEHPTTLLLSPQIFHETANAWMEMARRANPATRERLDDLARAVFAEPQP